MMCRFFEVADVVERRSESFGIFPVHLTDAGQNDTLFKNLDDPFYAADFRHWQVVEPDPRAMADLDAEVLALEKIRPHVPLEQATMAMRLSPELVGVQFHPEAHPPGMRRKFLEPERMQYVVEHHGEESTSVSCSGSTTRPTSNAPTTPSSPTSCDAPSKRCGPRR